MKKSESILLLVPLLGAVISCNRSPMEVDTSIEVPVSVMEVTTSSIEEFVSATGTVYPMQEVTLASEMAGKYFLQKNPQTGKPYALGDRVGKDATLIRLEDDEYFNNLRIRSREVDYEISKQEYEKQKSLYDKGGATLREVKDAEINLINTEYDLESNRIALEKMTITTPFDGVITELPYFTNGTKVGNNTELARVINFSRLYLEVQLPEKYYANIRRGLRVYVTSYTQPADTLVGTITQLSPEIDPDARTFACFVEVDNREKVLLPGMFVKADLVVNSSEATMVIPKDVVITRNRSQLVFVVDNGVARERYITTGLENENNIEVTTGIEPGESIVIKGFETLRDESRVKILR